MGYQPIEQTKVYAVACDLSDKAYCLVARWPRLAVDTVGTQWIRSLDSIGANLVEGDSRGSDLDSNRFFRYARGSAREARYWLDRAEKRDLLDAEAAKSIRAQLTECGKMLSGLIEYRKDSARNPFVKEEVLGYGSSETDFLYNLDFESPEPT